MFVDNKSHQTKMAFFNQKKDLIEGENPIDVLPGNVLRHGHFSLVLIASNNLRRIASQLIVTKRPDKKN